MAQQMWVKEQGEWMHQTEGPRRSQLDQDLYAGAAAGKATTEEVRWRVGLSWAPFPGGCAWHLGPTGTVWAMQGGM